MKVGRMLAATMVIKDGYPGFTFICTCGRTMSYYGSVWNVYRVPGVGKVFRCEVCGIEIEAHVCLAVGESDYTQKTG